MTALTYYTQQCTFKSFKKILKSILTSSPSTMTLCPCLIYCYHHYLTPSICKENKVTCIIVFEYFNLQSVEKTKSEN